MSLSGRSAVNQNSGEQAATTVAHQRGPLALLERAGRTANSSGNQRAAPASALQIASPRGSAASTPAARSSARRDLRRAR